LPEIPVHRRHFPYQAPAARI